MGKIVCIANQKGGVGKTTTCVNLGAALALLGKNILVVDFDPQGNASSGLGIGLDARDINIYHVIIDEEPIETVIRDTEIKKLRCIPSDRNLIGADVELLDMPDRSERLANALNTLREDYDYILIDCPPSLGQLTINAFVAADTVLVTLQSEYYALEGLSELMNTIELIKERLNERLDIEGFLVTMYDSRTNLANQVDSEIRKYAPDLTYKTRIPRNVRLSEAPSHGQPIFLYDARSTGAQAYLALGREVLKREKQRHKETQNALKKDDPDFSAERQVG